MNNMPNSIYVYEDYDGDTDGKWVLPTDDLSPDIPISILQEYVNIDVHINEINKILESAPIVGMYKDAEKFIDDYNKWKDKMFKEHYNG